MVTETLTVYRGDTDKYGNPNKTDHGTVLGVLSWGITQPSSPVGGRGEGASTGAELWVAKGTDLRARDRVKRANGDTYRVVGGAQWDQNHPITNRNFAWMVFRVEYV
jgi:hypothetical protein